MALTDVPTPQPSSRPKPPQPSQGSSRHNPFPAYKAPYLLKVPSDVLPSRKPGLVAGRVLLEPSEQRVRPRAVDLHLQ